MVLLHLHELQCIQISDILKAMMLAPGNELHMKINTSFKVNESCKGSGMPVICMEGLLFVDRFPKFLV